MSHRSLRPEGPALDHLAAAIKARLDRPLVLVGLMGAGKSRLGRMLAKNLSMPFYDCDAELEQSAGRGIGEIIAQIGAQAFHQAEARVLKRLIDQGVAVIATGGGADIESAATPAKIGDAAYTLWVYASLEVMIDRTTRNPDQRPLLKGRPVEPVLKALVDGLYPAYTQADAQIESREGPASETLYQAMVALAQALDKHSAAV
jgi:shikimate kinase